MKAASHAGAGAVAVLKGHGDTVRALALAGGRRTLVSGASDRALKLWDLTDQGLGAILEGCKIEVLHLDYCYGLLLFSSSW